MKSFKELSLNITEKEYRELPELSYSTLSRFQREGFRKIDSLFDKVSSPSLTFGSLVDTLLTDGEKAFDERFAVCDFPELTDSLKAVAVSLYSILDKDGSHYKEIADIPDSIISNVAVVNNYYASDRYANYRVKNVREQCAYYYSLLSLCDGKEVVSQYDYNDAVSCCEKLKTSPFTSKYFNANPFDTDMEHLYQLKFKAVINHIGVRCMPDLVIVDHKSKTVRLCDLKTTGHPEEEFEKSFYQWRYFIQAQLYTSIIRDVMDKDEYFKDFYILDYYFIVINRKTQAPVVFVYDGNFSTMQTVTDTGDTVPYWSDIALDLNYYLNYFKKFGKYPEYLRSVEEHGAKINITRY